MAAFQAAVDLGYRHLETDARVTADGVALAFHDEVLDRVTNSSGRLRQLSWRQVSTARIRGREPIPRLEEVLSAFGDGVSVNIDVKCDAAVRPDPGGDPAHQRLAPGPAGRLLRRPGCGGCAAGRARHRQRPHRRPRCWRCGTAGSAWPAPCPGRRGGGPGRPGAGPVRAAARSSSRGSWQRPGPAASRCTSGRSTSGSEMVRLLDLGVDAIMTDRADLLRDVLRERGQWPA